MVVAERFGVSTRTVRRITENFHTYGVVSPNLLAVGRPRELCWGDIIVCLKFLLLDFFQLTTPQYLVSLVQHTLNLHLSELKQSLLVQRGVSVHELTIWRLLRCAGYSRKKITISALKQNEDIHCQYILTVGSDFSAEQLVFVDESACNRITARRQFAWSPTGSRARRHDYFIRGKWQVPS